MKDPFIAAQRTEYPVERRCRVLGVARSGYYGWRACPISQRERLNQALTAEIQQGFEERQQTDGSRRIRMARRAKGIVCDRVPGVRLMRQAALRRPVVRRRVVTTQANPQDPTLDNQLARDFTATGPNQKWALAITCVPTQQGNLYLAGGLVLFSRKMVGWSMDDNLRDELTQAALHMALLTRPNRTCGILLTEVLKTPVPSIRPFLHALGST